MADLDLHRAALVEADARGRRYPAQVASNRVDAADAQRDFQAWHCIAEWLKSGRSPAGFIDGAGTLAEEWAEMAAAADRAIASTAEAHAKAEQGDDDAKLDRLAARLVALRSIGADVARQRSLVETLNQALQLRRTAERAAA